MKRSGFTMIELIFVIVILGILAAVAIPKLAATRDDAKISKALSELSTAISDMGAYYTAHGTFANPSTMTNVTDLNGTFSSSSGTGTFYYYTPKNDGTPEQCVKFDVNNSGGSLAVSAVSNPSGNVCQGVQSASTFTNDLAVPKRFGGGRVSF